MPYLFKDDIVDLVAPGSATDKKNFNRGLEILKNWGLRPRWFF